MADVSVRTATAADAHAIAQVQSAAWRQAYSKLLPSDVLDRLDDPATAEEWRAAVTDPPLPAYRVLVATAGTDVVGFASFGPAVDSDLDDGVDAEITGLSVLPDHRGGGHGSRLVAATVDHLRADGFASASAWLAEPGGPDDDVHRFLGGAGWAEDGGCRELDLRGDGTLVVAQVRLRTSLGSTT